MSEKTITFEEHSIETYLTWSTEELELRKRDLSNYRDELMDEQRKVRDALAIKHSELMERFKSLSPEAQAALRGKTFAPAGIDSTEEVNGSRKVG